MAKVITGLSTSVDGYITGPDPAPEEALGVGGGQLFDWYFNGDVDSKVFSGFHLSAASAPVFDELARRVGVVIAGRNTFDHSNGFGGGSPHPTAPLYVVTHRDVEVSGDQKAFAGIEEAIAAAKIVADAGGKDVALQGGGVITAALEANLLDELTIHQVPILLGGGVPFFKALPNKIQLQQVSVIPAAGVTHITYAVAPKDA